MIRGSPAAFRFWFGVVGLRGGRESILWSSPLAMAEDEVGQQDEQLVLALLHLACRGSRWRTTPGTDSGKHH